MILANEGMDTDCVVVNEGLFSLTAIRACARPPRGRPDRAARCSLAIRRAEASHDITLRTLPPWQDNNLAASRIAVRERAVLLSLSKGEARAEIKQT